MNLLNKIKSLIPNRKNKKDLVLVKSKIGIPTVRVCGVVLVDSGTNPCTGQQCSNDGSCPCNAWYSPTCPIQNPCLTLGCANYGGVAITYLDSPKPSEENQENIYFGGNSLEFKDSIVSLDGIHNVIFGKAVLSDDSATDCMCVKYNPNLVSSLVLIKIYNFIPAEEKKIICDSERIIDIEELLSSNEIKIPVFGLKQFGT
jgi:hypothetical protein